MFTQDGEPQTWKEMQNSSDYDQWHMVVQQEKQSLEKIGVFKQVKNAPKKPIQSKWVFKKETE